MKHTRALRVVAFHDPDRDIAGVDLARLAERAGIPPRLLARLRVLDPEQLQIVEVVVAAIARGATSASGLPPAV